MASLLTQIRKNFRTDFSLKLTILCFISALLLCQMQRLVLFLGFHNFFEALSFAKVLKAFASGFIFDASICASCFGIPLILMNIPKTGKKWLKFCSVLFIVLLTVFVILLAADLFYFPETHKHIAEELKWALNEMGFFVSFAFTKALPALIGVVIFIALATMGLFKVINKKELTLTTSKWWQAAKIFMLLIIFFLLQRGGFVRKNIGVADVYKYANSNTAAVLTMNGVFSAVNVSRKKVLSVKNTFPLNEAIKLLQPLALSKGETCTGGEKYPFMRSSSRALAKNKKPNIFFVMLEAWKYDSIDALTGKQNGDTPNFDKLVKDGLVFTNAYAVGMRSIYGFSGIFASLPIVPGLPVFGYGMEQNVFSPVFKLYKENGYTTSFTQASHRDSYRMCSLAKAMGADEAYGWEDMPQLLKYTFKPDYGYDYETLQFAADMAKKAYKAGKPFFVSAFTASTHAPFGYLLDDKRFRAYPNDSWEHGYRNSLRYSDWSIGEIIKRAKNEGWFENTIFIFMSDHTQHTLNNSAYESFHVPLVVYAPKYFKPEKRNYIVSQLDILPTLIELAGIRQNFSSLGRSILDKDRPQDRYAIISYGGNDFGIINKEGSLRHNMKKTIAFENAKGNANEQKMQDMTLAAHQVLYSLLQQNNWFSAKAMNEQN